MPRPRRCRPISRPIEQAEGAALAAASAACQRNRASALSSAIHLFQTAADDGLLEPGPHGSQNAAAVENAPAVGRLRDAAGQHVVECGHWPPNRATMPTTSRVALSVPRTTLPLSGAKGITQFRRQRMGSVDGVAEIRREEQEALAQVALQFLPSGTGCAPCGVGGGVMWAICSSASVAA